MDLEVLCQGRESGAERGCRQQEQSEINEAELRRGIFKVYLLLQRHCLSVPVCLCI